MRGWKIRRRDSRAEETGRNGGGGGGSVHSSAGRKECTRSVFLLGQVFYCNT